MINYLEKYLKYKTKYLNLKKQIGGTLNIDLLNAKIEKFNKIIQDCDGYDNSFTVDVVLPGDKLNKIIKKSQIPTYSIPRKVLANHFFIYVRTSDKWASFIDVYFENDIIKYNYSFTREEYRRLGLSKLLRLLVIDYGYHNSRINSVVSTPFEEAHSKPLLDGFNFEKGEGPVVFLQLSKIEDIEQYISDKLKKYCDTNSDKEDIDKEDGDK